MVYGHATWFLSGPTAAALLREIKPTGVWSWRYRFTLDGQGAISIHALEVLATTARKNGPRVTVDRQDKAGNFLRR